MSETIPQAPAFQFYPKDFLAGTADMSNAEVGAYIRLLCHQWDKGGYLPDDDKKLTRLCGGDGHGIKVAKTKFIFSEGMIINKRLEKERSKQKEFRELQREKGLKSAEKRRLEQINRGSNPVDIRLQPKSNSAAASSSSIKKQQVADTLQKFSNPDISTERLMVEAEKLMKKYAGESIGNLEAVCTSWIANMKNELVMGDAPTTMHM